MRKLSMVIVVTLVVLTVVSGSHAQEFVWARQFGGAGADEGTSGGWVEVDTDGNVFSSGHLSGTADFDPGPGTYNLTSAGSFDVFISKLDPSGNFAWARRIGGVAIESVSGIAVDGEHNSYIAGNFEGTVDFDPGLGIFNLTSSGPRSLFLLKLNTEGGFLWAKRFGSDITAPNMMEIEVDSSGDVYLVGDFGLTMDFDPGPGIFNMTAAGRTDPYVLKLDGAGNFIWARRVGSSSNQQELGNTIDSDQDGNVYFSGLFYETADFDPGPATYHLTSAGDRDAFVVKLSSSGNFLRAGRIGSEGWNDALGVVGTVGSYVYLNGVGIQGMDIDPGPGIYNLTSAGGFVSKLDSAGNLVWVKEGPATSLVGGTTDELGNVYMQGEFSQTTDFDPGPATFYLTPVDGWNFFVWGLSPDGDFLWAGQYDKNTNQRLIDIAATDRGDALYTSGFFYGTTDIDPGPEVFEITSIGGKNVFVSKLGICVLADDTVKYGRLVFSPRCAQDAGGLEEDTYASMTIGINRGAIDAFYVSSHGWSFAPVVADDEIRVNGASCGPGPYTPRGAELVVNVPIEENWIPSPAHDITSCLPATGDVLFELLDTDRVIYGNTAIYLVRDCGIYLGKTPDTTINWLSHHVEIEGFTSNLDIVSGVLSELRSDHGFSRACDLGSFLDSTQMVDARIDPAVGDGYYYLVSGTCAQPIAYGYSTLSPDPRGELETMSPPICP